LLVGIIAPKSGRPLELRDRGVKRTVLVVWRAEKAQARVRLGAQALQDGLGDS
jgi:hypothetical protein